jgi:predicted tellurium resistance membrane protein TerC
MESIFTVEALMALLTLTVLEVVLGIDNIIFISILSNKLEAHKQKKARTLGLVLAMVVRLILLSFVSYLVALQSNWFTVFGYDFSGKDVILLVGGLFLIAKAVSELSHKMYPKEHQAEQQKKASTSFSKAIIQIVLLDIVFSVDSILTAIGLTDNLPIMMIAVVISIGIMIAFGGAVSDFINKHPSLQVLALAFLILIGFTLVLEIQAIGTHIPKGYIYFAVAFSLLVEFVNIKTRKKTH